MKKIYVLSSTEYAEQRSFEGAKVEMVWGSGELNYKVDGIVLRKHNHFIDPLTKEIFNIKRSDLTSEIKFGAAVNRILLYIER